MVDWKTALTILRTSKLSGFPSAGYYIIITAALLAALVHVIAKPLLSSSEFDGFEINPIVLAACIYIINGVFFTPISRKCTPIGKMGSRNLVLIAIIGIAEVSALITYFFGLKDSTAVNASIFSNGEIIFSLIIAITIYRERLQKKELTPFSMILFGMIVLPLGYDFYQHGITLSNIVFGDLLIIFSGFLYAIDINICKYVSDRFDSKRIAQLTSFVSGIFALSLIFVFQIPFDINFEQIPGIAVLAIFGTGISTLFFLIALRLIGAVRTVLIYSTTSIFGIIFSIIFLSEAITIVNIISIGMVLVGIYLLRNRLGDENKDHADDSISSHLEQQTTMTLNNETAKPQRIKKSVLSNISAKVRGWI